MSKNSSEGAPVVPEAVTPSLRDLIDQLLQTNQLFNLTATRTFEEAWVKHIEDSLQGLQTQLFEGNKKAVDVGAGPGFPGLPLALARRDLRWTFMEATGKKCGFIKEMSARFDLDATVVNDRAEKLGQEVNYRERFALATCRAVGKFPEVAEYCLPLLKMGGHAVFWRGQDGPQEARQFSSALRKLGGEIGQILPYNLPGHSPRYHLLVVEKTGDTPREFPRRIGIPKQQPLE